MRWDILCGMSLGTAISLLVITVLIRINGSVTFVEPWPWILYGEMPLLSAIIGYTIWLSTKIRR